jgi:DNA-binding response OmpR family regulator
MTSPTEFGREKKGASPDKMRAEPSPARQKRALRVLLAEDDGEMRRLLASVFAKDGYQIIEVENGEDLVNFFRFALLDKSLCGSVDVVVSDLRMPGYSGLEALAGLRAAGCAVPFILITAFGSEEIHQQARDLGATAVFDKPFDMVDLRTVVLNIAPPEHFPRDIPHLPRPVRIFLAEDDTELRSLLTTCLRKDGFEVVEVEDGTRLVDTLESELIDPMSPDPVDMIISDIRMPGWSGMDMLSGIRKAGWRTPVILMTAFGDRETHRKARELGVTTLIDKPFYLEDFRTVVLYITRRILARLPTTPGPLGGHHA